MIRGLHHNAYRCRDSEETRIFYEDFLGLRLVSAFEIDQGRGLHIFFEMDDGSCLAFFEVPGSPFDFKEQNALDLHIALGVEPETFESMLEGEGRRPRGTRARGSWLCSLDLLPRSQRLRHRTDRQHRAAWRNHGSCRIEAARGARALAGGEEQLNRNLAQRRAGALLGPAPQAAFLCPGS